MGALFWTALGATVGYFAAKRRGFSPITGAVTGLVLGPLALALFYVPLGIADAKRSTKCPYCAGPVASDARVCLHCGAILQSGWG